MKKPTIVLKRNGEEATFDRQKIYNAVNAANKEVDPIHQLSSYQMDAVTSIVTEQIAELPYTVSVEEIQDMVEIAIMEMRGYEVAQKYVRYRHKRELARKSNTTDDGILALINLSNEEIKQENSNKNPIINSTQRDYMAGEVSKDLTKRVLLPEDIVKAHEEGIIHFHDSDYFAQKEYNCSLVNLEDMFQNGTVISGTMIETPKSFFTGCNVATQIVSQVASNQYGGQTFTLSHLAQLVDVSRQKITKNVKEELTAGGVFADESQIAIMVNKRLQEEIKNGIQTIQYQLVTLMTTNGQTPFVSVLMYLDEVPEGQTREDLAMIIEEVLKQRIQGVKNEKGVWVTPAFPKLLYVLDKDNITEDSKYWYLTELAAKCTAKRMVPDYLSAKVMKEVKAGEVFPCMGCVDGKEVITYRYHNMVYTESFERMWFRLSKYYPVELQPNGKDYLMKTPGVEIYDQMNGFVENYGIIKNRNSEWVKIAFSNGRFITCTPDHPFETKDGRIVFAKDLTAEDLIAIDKTSSFSPSDEYSVKLDRAWLYGFTLCDSTYYDNYTVSIALDEQEIENNFGHIMSKEYDLESARSERHRGKKGNYVDIRVKTHENENLTRLKMEFIHEFEGKAKNDRHIPNEVFSWNLQAKLAFLAGMIDADGYLNTTSKKAKIQIGSTNKELAIQQMLLAQNCGMFAAVYPNFYKANCKEKVRYRVEFCPTEKLLSYIKCSKKMELHHSVLHNTNNSSVNDDYIHMTSRETFYKEDFCYDVTTESSHFTVSGIYSHNCRSFLTVEDSQLNPDGSHKFYGRFNQGVVTINLVDVACSSNGNMEQFWKLLDERLELCHRALRCRHERLLHTKSDVAPILWQHGAIARLKKGETIDKLLYNGYSTISLGYAGLYEMCVRMTGHSHTDPRSKDFALAVMQKLNDKCKEWRAAENIAYSVYGTPMESTTYKFAKCLKKRFGIIPGVTDKNYITNSYHVHVTEKIDAFSKLKFESEFQKLSPGGAISYVEVPNLQNNIPAVLSVMKFIYENIMYAELNTKSDYCEACGYDGEIKIVADDSGKLVWECPNCGNRDQSKMSVARRTCGYIGTQFWNQGRTQEIKDRVMHMSCGTIE